MQKILFENFLVKIVDKEYNVWYYVFKQNELVHKKEVSNMTERIISKAEYQEAEQVKAEFLKLPPDARRTYHDLLCGGVLLNNMACAANQQTTATP